MQKTNNDVNKNKEEKNKIPLWLWIIVGLLASVFIVWSLFFGFWSFIIVSIIWLILIIVLKKSTLSLIMVIVSIVVVSIFSIFYLTVFAGGKNNSSNSSVKSTEPLPKLEMTVVKAPSDINCSDEVSKIEVQAKNIGNKDLTFAEVQAKKYDFGICDAEKTDSISCYPLVDGYLSVNNFDSIKPGEAKTIVFTTPAKYADNAITSFQKAKVNGTYKYYINFSQIKNPKLKPTLSKSNVFAVKTNIMNPKNEYIKADCQKK